MTNYSFRIKKGQYLLDVCTTDREFLVEQFEVWVNDAAKYAKQAKAKECKELINSQIKEEEMITNRNIEKHLAHHSSLEQSTVEENSCEQEQENKPLKEESSNLNKNDNLDIFYAPPVAEVPQKLTINEHQGGVFDSILENSLNNPKTELTFKPSPSIKKDNAFINFITARKIEKKIDYLLLTSYYFTQYEQKPRFTLKQLNAKLMQNLAVIIDHSVLQEAINRSYIECLPDLTGLVGTSEYRLTAYGEKVLLDE